LAAPFSPLKLRSANRSEAIQTGGRGRFVPMPVKSHSTETRQARQKGTIRLCGMRDAPRPSYLVYVSRVTPSRSAISSIGYRAIVRACLTRAAKAAQYCFGVTRRLFGLVIAAALRTLDTYHSLTFRPFMLRSLSACSNCLSETGFCRMMRSMSFSRAVILALSFFTSPRRTLNSGSFMRLTNSQFSKSMR
jgi:hypothetical protein